MDVHCDPGYLLTFGGAGIHGDRVREQEQHRHWPYPRVGRIWSWRWWQAIAAV